MKQKISKWIKIASLYGICLGLILMLIKPAFIYSDGFYYLVIARNFIEYGQFTFDSIHLTNGFHWGWMMILIGVGNLLKLLGISLKGEIFLNVVIFIETAFYLGSALLFTHLISKIDSKKWWPIITTIFVFCDPFLINKTLNGLETSLLIFGLLALAIFFRKKEIYSDLLIGEFINFNKARSGSFISAVFGVFS